MGFGPMTSTCYNIDDPEILRASIRAGLVFVEKFLEAPRRSIPDGPLTSMNEFLLLLIGWRRCFCGLFEPLLENYNYTA